MVWKQQPAIVVRAKAEKMSKSRGNVINPDDIGNVWTIQSNEEKNVASVKEGKLWK